MNRTKPEKVVTKSSNKKITFSEIEADIAEWKRLKAREASAAVIAKAEAEIEAKLERLQAQSETELNEALAAAEKVVVNYLTAQRRS
ncbi:MAG: hypothetical protein WA183_02810 [Chthoniobacterales bacterium]